MRVIKDLSKEIPGTNTYYFRLDELSEDDKENVLLYGYTNLFTNKSFDLIKGYKRKIYLNVTMPTEFCSDQDINLDNKFDEIYGICPYSVRWLNEIKGVDKYKAIFYPFNELDIPKNNVKKYDVCYHGGIHSDEYVQCLDIMGKFNYRYMSMTTRVGPLTRQCVTKYATNVDLTNEEKLNLIAECKISICYNTFPIRNQSDVNNIKSKKDWFKNEAFKHVDDLMIAPQFKSRFNEAAMSKTLNLIKRDPWNLVEDYYTPGEDFIYFDSNDELEDKIKDILDNWDDYKSVVESAYKKSLNYTSQNLYNIIK